MSDASEKKLEPRKDDRSEVHLRWLVEKRSANQKATLDFFVALKNHQKTLYRDVTLSSLAQDIAGIAFSLWRAVFLADLTETEDSQLFDVENFLGALISNNAIGYPQDRGAREWTFQYYLSDARYRLERLTREPPNIIDVTDIDQPVLSAKADWEVAQRALEKAVSKFAELTRPDRV